ncbi:MAG: glycosyltransferase family 2 protein [Filimonas sp.]|nr:glycosyltransferase family 2 protein [Filimonas sp.]
MEKQKAYIILVNYNGWQDTIECINSLLAQEYALYEIIVVDNCSTNDSRAALLHWADTTKQAYKHLHYRNSKFEYIQQADRACITFIWSDKNGGFSYGNNIGVHYSFLQSDQHFVWFLNNDTVVFKDTLSILADFFIQRNATQKVGLVGCLQLFYHNPALIQCTYGHYKKILGLPEQLGEGVPVNDIKTIPQKRIDYLSGASMFTHSSALSDAGLLNDDYFLFYEELDFAYRLKRKHYTLLFCADASILHKHGSSIDGKTSKGSEASPFSNYHHFRSKFLFAKKYYKPYVPLYLLITGLQVLNRLLKGNKQSAMAVLKGTRDGLLK